MNQNTAPNTEIKQSGNHNNNNSQVWPQNPDNDENGNKPLESPKSPKKEKMKTSAQRAREEEEEKKKVKKKPKTKRSPASNAKRIIFKFDFENYEYLLNKFKPEDVGNRCTTEELKDIFSEVYAANDDYKKLKKLTDQRKRTFLFGLLVFSVFSALWVIALFVQNDIGPFFVFSILGFLYGITILG